MLRALGRRSRLLAGAAGLAAFAAAYATTPLSARDAAGVRPAHGATAAFPVARDRVAIVVPRRDPFAYVDAAASAPARPAASGSIAAALPAIPALLGALPPNAGARGDVAPAAFRVAAVITGSHPFALVYEGATTRLIAPGDAAGGSIVDDIRADGVHLRSGAIVPPAPGNLAVPEHPQMPQLPPVVRPGGR